MKEIDLIRAGLITGVQLAASHDFDAEVHDRLADAAAAVDELELEGRLRAAAVRAGVHAPALDDVVRRGRVVFEVDHRGTVVHKAGAALTPEEWAVTLRLEAPHLFA